MKKIAVSLIIFMMFIAAGFLSGCSSAKDELNLPDSEKRQLERMKKGSGEKKSESEDPSKLPMAKVKKFYVYVDKGYFKNHFIPSGWMGDYGDIKFTDGWRENSYSRKTCIRIVYTAQRKEGAGWAGVYWQEPVNNWGNIKGGYNLTGAKKLTFYARGENGGELVTEFKMGGIGGEYSDSTSASIGPIALTKDWKKYTVNLDRDDLSNVIGGFCFVVSAMENPEGITFYIDEIAYEK